MSPTAVLLLLETAADSCLLKQRSSLGRKQRLVSPIPGAACNEEDT